MGIPSQKLRVLVARFPIDMFGGCTHGMINATVPSRTFLDLSQMTAMSADRRF